MQTCDGRSAHSARGGSASVVCARIPTTRNDTDSLPLQSVLSLTVLHCIALHCSAGECALRGVEWVE